MPLDTNIPLQAKAPEFNPLAQMLQVSQYKYLNQNSNKLQKDMDANQAIGAAIQRNTGADGKVNLAGVQADLAQDPNAAYNLQAATGTNLAQQGQQIANGTAQIGQQGAQLALTTDQQSHLAQQLGTLLNKPNVTYADAIHTAAQAGEMYGLPADVVKQSIAAIPTDPKEIKPFLQSRLASLQPAGAQLTAMTPTPNVQDLGGSKTIVDANPISNPGIIGQNFNKTLAPESIVSRVPMVNSNGQAGSVPLGSTAPASLLPPGAQGGAPAAPGRYPAGGQAPANGGFIPSQAPAGVNEAASVAGQGSGQQLVQDSQAAAGSGSRITQLQSALKAIEGAGSIGPGTEGVNRAKSFLLAQSDLAKYLPGIDPEKVKNYDEANKYLTQYASAKASALGGNTDSKLATTLSANASTKISDLAAKEVVKANIGLERMQQAQMAAWNASGLPASDYRTWAAKFGSAMDPRVFIADQLDPAHVKKLYSGMQAKEQQQFRAQYNWAVQNGYINGPQ